MQTLGGRKVILNRIGTDEQKSVFDRKFRYHLGEALDVEAMRRAAQDLVGTHDFKTFCGNPKMKKSTVRTVTDIVIEESSMRYGLCIREMVFFSIWSES